MNTYDKFTVYNATYEWQRSKPDFGHDARLLFSGKVKQNPSDGDGYDRKIVQIGSFEFPSGQSFPDFNSLPDGAIVKILTNTKGNMIFWGSILLS